MEAAFQLPLSLPAWLWGKGSETVHFSSLYVTDGAGHECITVWQFVFVRLRG